MAVRPAVPNVIKHQLMIVLLGQFCVTTIYSKHSTPLTSGQAADDQEQLRAWADGSWKTAVTVSGALRQIKSYGLDTVPPTKYPSLDLYPSATITGTQSSTCMPPETCIVLSLRTGLTTDVPRPPHGRIYHVGSPVAALAGAGGAISGAHLAFVTDIYDALRYSALPGTGGHGRFCVVSYFDGGTRAAPVLRGSPLALDVTRVQSSTTWGSQRRREPHRQPFLLN